jgi:class 3 adenylate cyclase
MPPTAAHLANRALVMSDIAGTAGMAAKLGDLATHNVIRWFHHRAAALASQHNGRLIKEIGDSFLAVFEEPADGLRFARALPAAFYEDKLVVSEGLALALALHLGEVSVADTPYGEDVFGQNVNLIARLVDLAGPRELIISEAAMQHLPAERLGAVARRETSELKRIGKVEFGRLQLAA